MAPGVTLTSEKSYGTGSTDTMKASTTRSADAIYEFITSHTQAVTTPTYDASSRVTDPSTSAGEIIASTRHQSDSTGANVIKLFTVVIY